MHFKSARNLRWSNATVCTIAVISLWLHTTLSADEHGSWNRSQKTGCKVSRVVLSGDKAVKYLPFAYGWLDQEKQEYAGRPVDIVEMPDGALLVSDDSAGVIYRISYQQKAL